MNELYDLILADVIEDHNDLEYQAYIELRVKKVEAEIG